MSETNWLLTTLDNPYNPFTQFDEWYSYDTEAGYNTLGYIARLTQLPEDPTESESDEEYYSVCEEILRFNLTGNYTKAYPPDSMEERETLNGLTRAERVESYKASLQIDKSKK